jgi:hypothetical protein
MLVFNKYFYKNKKSKLYFGDRVTVLNDFIYQTRGSMSKTTNHLLNSKVTKSFSIHLSLLGHQLRTQVRP